MLRYVRLVFEHILKLFCHLTLSCSRFLNIEVKTLSDHWTSFMALSIDKVLAYHDFIFILEFFTNQSAFCNII